MTSDELRALDRRVAELLGHIVWEPDWEPGRLIESVYPQRADLGGIWRALQHYSTDPRASRVLLEEMPLAALYREGGGWLCDPDQDRANHWERYDINPDAAICLAWCAWREAQVQSNPE